MPRVVAATCDRPHIRTFLWTLSNGSGLLWTVSDALRHSRSKEASAASAQVAAVEVEGEALDGFGQPTEVGGTTHVEGRGRILVAPDAV